jgi:predicted DNA-binding protein with PD1-like motif
VRSKVLAQANGQRTILLLLDSGEDAIKAIQAFARDHKVSGASLFALGAFEKASVGWFDFNTRQYRPVEVPAQCEVISVLGDVATDADGEPSVHLHAVLGLSDGTTRGGHLLRGIVRPTLEITMTEVPAHLKRLKRPDLGIALIDLDQ